MNKPVDSDEHNIANMDKRVQFAAKLARKNDALEVRQEASMGSSGWYTAKELKAFRREVSASLDAAKARNDPCSKESSHSKIADSNDDNCMRGLELYSSTVRRDLQKHYSRSIIEAQRRIKARQKRKRAEDEEDALLLQRLAEKYSQYARERAVQIAARDEVDSRQVYAESQVGEPPLKKQFQQQQQQYPSKAVSKAFHPSIRLSLSALTVPHAPTRLGMPGNGHR